MKSSTGAYLELSVGTALAGSSIAAGKIMSESMPVFLSQALSLLLALAVLMPLLLKLEGRIFDIPKKDLPILLLQALLSMFLFRVFLLTGLKSTTAIQSSIVTGTTPAVTAILSVMLLKEKVQWKKVIGITITVAGIIIINLNSIQGGKTGAGGSLTGNLLVFLAVIGEALLTILRKKTSDRVSNLAAATYITMFSFLMFLPVSVVQSLSFDFVHLKGSQWAYVAYYGIAVTALAYILWFRGVSKVPASTAAAYTGVMPVTALVLSLLVLKESMTFPQLAGAISVLAGILLVTFSGSRFLKRGNYTVSRAGFHQ